MSVWEGLRDALDPLRARPRLRGDVEFGPVEPTADGRWCTVKNPQSGTFLRVSERERDLLSSMDGQRTIKEIILEDFTRRGALAFGAILDFVDLLHRGAFLTSEPVDLYRHVREALRAGSAARGWTKRLVAGLVRAEFAIPGFDRRVAAVHGSVGRFLVDPWVAVGLGLVALCGFVVYWTIDRPHRVPIRDLLAGEAGPLILLAAIALYLASTFMHEYAHALACKAFGRRVERGGLMIFFGMPVFFVDTTDIWLAPRRQRILVSAAGPFVDFVLAGVCVLLAAIMPPVIAAAFMGVASLVYVRLLFILCPLIPTDGYYILVDLLQMPLLRQRAFAFLRAGLRDKLRLRTRLTREDFMLLAFGLLAAAYTAFVVLHVLQSGHWLLAPLGLVLGLAFCVPLAVKLVHQSVALASTFRRGARRVGKAVRSSRLKDRMALLRDIPLLADLSPAQLSAIAAGLRRRTIPAGREVVRQGEPGDRFYLIVRGQAEVVKAGQNARIVARLGPGDYFGELALLNQAPRAATVRATSWLQVLELAARDFQALVLPTWRHRERMRRAIERRERVGAIALFGELEASARDVLLSAFEDEAYSAGRDIVTQGDRGDRFYVIESGRVGVFRLTLGQAERQVAELGPGEYFGEIALLHDVPRTATVRALADVALWSLQRREFDDLLRRYARLGDRLEAIGAQRLHGLAAPSG